MGRHVLDPDHDARPGDLARRATRGRGEESLQTFVLRFCVFKMFQPHELYFYPRCQDDRLVMHI